MTRARRLRIALVALVAAALAAAGWYGWWLLAGGLLQRSLDDWSRAERAAGGGVSVGALTLGGFPFSVRAEAREVAVSRSDGSGWRTPALTAEAPLWSVTAPRLRMSGVQEIRLPGGQQITAAGGEGRLSLGGASGITLARLALTEVAAQPAGPVIDRLELSVELPARTPVNGTETGLTLAAAAEGVHLTAAEAAGLPLGPLVERLAFNARLQGAPPSAAPASLARWSQSGGSLLIDGAHLRWGAVSVDTSGALELDRDLQPAGTLTTAVTGFGPAVEALAAAGWIRAKDVHTVKAVLTGLSPRGAGGGPPVARLPISLHDRFVHVGPFRLMPLPALVWLGDQRMPNQTTEAAPAIRQ